MKQLNGGKLGTFVLGTHNPDSLIPIFTVGTLIWGSKLLISVIPSGFRIKFKLIWIIIKDRDQS